MSLFPNQHSFCSQNTKSNEEDSQVNTIKAGPKDALQLVKAAKWQTSRLYMVHGKASSCPRVF